MKNNSISLIYSNNRIKYRLNIGNILLKDTLSKILKTTINKRRDFSMTFYLQIVTENLVYEKATMIFFKQ